MSADAGPPPETQHFCSATHPPAARPPGAETNKSKHRCALAEVIFLRRSDYDAVYRIHSDGVRRHGNRRTCSAAAAVIAGAVDAVIFRSSVASSVRRLLAGGHLV